MMKKSLIFAFAIIAFYGCQKDIINDVVYEQEENSSATRVASDLSEYYYWCDGEKIPLTINESKVYVLTETSKHESFVKAATAAGGKAGNSEIMENHAPLGIAPSSKNFKLRTSLTSFTLDNTNLRSIDTKELVYVAPYYKTSDGADIGITNVFSVRVKGERDLARLEQIAEENRLKILGNDRFDTSIYYLSCTKESKGNALEMANFMYESGAFEYATPEFLIKSSGDYTYVDNPYFSSQWNLYNTTYPGIDIGYVNAMSIVSTANLSNIIVAVVDNGVIHHLDLPLHHVSYDAHTGTSPSIVYGDHGTAVAGVIGATTNNNIGIAGVASGVKIMPISICYTQDATKLGITGSSSARYAVAIRFAADNGAKVINNSWSFDTSFVMHDINDAITYAHSKGCVVVFSSGNNSLSPTVKQPAAGAPSDVLVVGRIDKNGSRAASSGYGSSLDVVAPGTDIWTTSLTGGYILANGTSYAAPHVSGIAALIWATNPSLTQKQVVDLIEKTAKKVGGYSYTTTSGRTNGGWNNEMGYGLVDAYMPILPPLPAPIGNSTPDVNTNITYTIPSLPPGVTFSGWTVNIHSDYHVVIGGTTGSSLTIKFTTLAMGSIIANYTLPNGSSRQTSISVRTHHLPTITHDGGRNTPSGLVVTFTGNTPLLNVPNVQWGWMSFTGGTPVGGSGNVIQILRNSGSNIVVRGCAINMQGGYFSEMATSTF